jgi:hypothetical protein
MNRIILSTTLALAATPFAMYGADSSDNPNSTDNPNRLFLGPRFGLNFKADFHSDASYFNAVNPGLAVGDANHTYNDGYVLVDSSGDAGGLTRYWGYQNSSQVVRSTVAMQFHAIQSSSPSSATDNPQYGAELVYQRVIGSLPFLSGCWGLETGFGFTDLDLRNNRNETASVTTDVFSLGGVTPPSAGYNGTFSGPGALLGDIPTRASESATMTSNQKLSGQLFGIRLGPFAELNFTPQLSLAASVGLTLAPALVDYNFSETATLAGGDAFSASGHSSKTKLLYGPYVGGMLRYAFNKSWGVYVGVQFQNLTDLEESVGGRTARLDPGFTAYGTVGASWSF